MFIKILNDFSSPELQYEAIWALANISTGTTENIQSLINSGSIPTLIQLLNDSTSPDVIESIWCLGNIAGGSTQFQDELLKSGVVHPILKIASGNPKISILRNSVWCLSTLFKGNAATKFKYLESSIPILCSLLTSNEEVLTDACWAYLIFQMDQTKLI